VIIMPYIEQGQRKPIDDLVRLIKFKSDCKIGIFNYLITRFMCSWIKSKGESYTTYNELIGVLEAAKLELYRRLVSKYEDTKLASSGECYDIEPSAPKIAFEPSIKPKNTNEIETDKIRCPECNFPVVQSEGCMTCQNCGWSKCS